MQFDKVHYRPDHSFLQAPTKLSIRDITSLVTTVYEVNYRTIVQHLFMFQHTGR